MYSAAKNLYEVTFHVSLDGCALSILNAYCSFRGLWNAKQLLINLFFGFTFAEPKNDLFLFYGKGRPGIIRGLDINIKSNNEHMLPVEDLVNPRALDYHAETGYIYFADTTSFLIGRQKTDGNSRETILKDGNCYYKTFISFLL